MKQGLNRLLASVTATASVVAASPSLAQSPYELRLGMHENSVKVILGENLGAVDASMSTGRETWYRSENYDLVICDHKLTAFRIGLKPSLSSWSNAVERAKQDRGQPEIEWRSAVFGQVTAKWRVAPYQFLSISLDEYSDGRLEASRWMQDLRKCDTPLAL